MFQRGADRESSLSSGHKENGRGSRREDEEDDTELEPDDELALMVEAVLRGSKDLARVLDNRFSEVGDGNRGQVIAFLAETLLIQPEGLLQVPKLHPRECVSFLRTLKQALPLEDAVELRNPALDTIWEASERVVNLEAQTRLVQC